MRLTNAASAKGQGTLKSPLSSLDGSTVEPESLSARSLSSHKEMRKNCKCGPTAGKRASELQQAWNPALAL